MANITWYGDGTATVAVGSRTVTGTETGWLTEVAGLTPIKAGDKFGIHVGRPIVIERIISDTELLLADDWPGPAQTDAPYKVELTSPTIAAVEAMRRLLASLSNGNLDSIADATIGTDDLLIGIGPGVLAPVNKANLGYLVGPSSSADGAFAAFNGTSGKYIKQLSASSALAALKGVGAYAKDNILGTVSQSSGVPTGAVMETNSNANGIYVRFASGIQLCSFQLPLSYSTASDMIGNWNYPAVFSDLPFISYGETQFWSGSVKSYAMRTRSANRGSSGMTVVSSNPSSNNASGDIYYVHVTATGRWF